MLHYKQLPLNTDLFQYNDLSSDAQVKARQEVLDVEKKAIAKKILEVRLKLKVNINSLVNDKVYIPSILRHKDLIKNLGNDATKCAKFIDSNFCNFLSDGTYITYSK